jgi:hypothetical protein
MALYGTGLVGVAHPQAWRDKLTRAIQISLEWGGGSRLERKAPASGAATDRSGKLPIPPPKPLF